MEKRPPTIDEMLPGLGPDKLRDAEDILDLYLKLVLRIYERLESETNSTQLTPERGTLSCTRSESEPSNSSLSSP